MAKSAEKPVTLNHVAKMVERGFADVYGKMDKGFSDVRSELSKKADKTDLVAFGAEIGGLKTEIGGLKTEIGELKDDINKLATATKFGFDEVQRELDTKASKIDLRQSEERVKQRLGNLDRRLDEFVTHEKRLVRVEKTVGLTV